MALRSRLAMLMAFALAFATALFSAPAATADAADHGRLPQVWPPPQSITARAGSVSVPGVVRLVTDADQGSVDVTTAALKRAGARRVVRSGDADLTVFLGGDPARAALPELDVRSPDGLPSGGYALGIGKRTIALAGVDPDGTFYAAQTLRQLARGRHFPAVAVRDWPGIGLRGVIEGFYGAPWSDADRLSQLDFYARTKQNIYVYSPKDDPYLRAQWRDPYPADRLAALRRLVARATYDHVAFTYALSPGLSVCYSSDADERALVAKFESLYAIGIRSFAIPLDDISYTRWNCAADEQQFGTGPEAAGIAQASLLDRVQHDFIAAHPDVAALQMVPTEYSDVTASPYKAALQQHLDQKILVEWTGVGVVAPVITAAQAAAAERAYAHRILVWDNYPVNDFETDRLFLGPYIGRDPGIAEYVAGVTANPMVQARPSAVAEFTSAAFLWNPEAYDPDAAWRQALRNLGGAAWPALAILAENSYSSRLHRAGTAVPDPESAPLRALTERYRVGQDLGGLARYFGRMAAAPAQLAAHAPDPALVEQAGPWLQVLSAYGRAGGHALRMLEADRDRHPVQARHEREAVIKAMDAAHSVTVATASGSVRPSVAAGVFEPFIEKVLGADAHWRSTGEIAALRAIGPPPVRSCADTQPRCVLV